MSLVEVGLFDAIKGECFEGGLGFILANEGFDLPPGALALGVREVPQHVIFGLRCVHRPWTQVCLRGIMKRCFFTKDENFYYDYDHEFT